jgi:hypothetical protein
MDARTVRDLATLEAALKESKGALRLTVHVVDLTADTKGFLVAVSKVYDWDNGLHDQVAEATGTTVLEAMEYLGRHWDSCLVG